MAWFLMMPTVMQKTKHTKLRLNTQTIRQLTPTHLDAVVGGGQKSNGCTKKNSECNACEGTYPE